MEQRDHMICIVGPTASGKTALSVRLAQALGGEIVSFDSMQVYRRMDIGTAKPTPEERGGVPHHMLDVADPAENYSVSRYVQEADACVQDILSRGKPVILVGGTGLYRFPHRGAAVCAAAADRQARGPGAPRGRGGRTAASGRAARRGPRAGGAAVRLGRKAHRPRAGDLAGDRQDHDGLRPGEPGDPAALPAAVARPALPGARAALCPHRSARGADVCAGTCAGGPRVA